MDDEEKVSPLEQAFSTYIHSGRYIKTKNAEIEHLATRLASQTHERNEMMRAREDAFAVLEKYLTAEAIAELKAAQP